ncbi:Aldo/keto reductase [Peniophora sp. CONT]|nr:Aldo/keto reductase [Peniophora sp. CONT]
MSISRVKLNDGNTIPWLGFGTGTANYGKDCAKLITAAIQNGFTHLDGAQVYRNEEWLGEGIVASGKPRAELFVTTKVHIMTPEQTVRGLLVESLEKLKTDYVDLFLIHAAVNHPGKLKEIWKALEALKKEGLTKSIGVSNFRVQDLENIMQDAEFVPAVNQIEFHAHLLKDSAALLDFHAKHGIVTESFGSLSPLFRSKGSAVDRVVDDIASRWSKETGKSYNAGHVMLSWLRKKDIVALTTSTKVERIQDYIAVAEAPELTSEDIKAINDAGSQETHRHFTRFWPPEGAIL